MTSAWSTNSPEVSRRTQFHINEGVKFDFLIVIKIPGYEGNVLTFLKINLFSFTSSMKFNEYSARPHYDANGLILEKVHFGADGQKQGCTLIRH